ncbi:MAG: HAMP domain-containing sensor histidine kinase [Burkholderiaceae bacterium]
MEHTARDPRLAGPAPPAQGVQPGGFRLMRYFTMMTLVAFAAVALALYFLQRMEITFFEQVQHEQGAFFAQAQAELARQHEGAARSSLLAVHEAGHVNLTRVVANLLWDTDFAPFVARAQRLAVDQCRAIAAPSDAPLGAAASNGRRACFAELGRRIMSLPGFRALDAKAYAAMRSSTVFKIKVFDLRGVTLYSSEHRQIGEDGVDNLGWKSAAAGRPASELTHRDRFSAFERVVENRDLISTYVPVRATGRDEVVGVFEIYSDVTPFLGQIQAASKKFTDHSASNEARVEQTARLNQDKVNSSSDRFLLVVGALLALLYAASLLIVHNGQRIIDRQTIAQEQSMRREQLWHRDKMAALAAMAANVSHEVGNPLAVISGLAQELADRQAKGESVAGPSKQIVEQTSRIARMMRQISDFATARGETREWVDVNSMLKAVCDFLSFDRRFRATPIEFHPGQGLPARELVPDHLNEVMMNLLQACVHSAPQQGARIRIETHSRGDSVQIRVECAGAADGSAATIAPAFPDERLESVHRRVIDMGGKLVSTGATLTISLPASSPDAAST